MSPLHAPGATIAHPVFVNSTHKKEATIKVAMFSWRIRDNEEWCGYSWAADTWMDSLPAALHEQREDLIYVFQSEKKNTQQGFVFVYFTPRPFLLCTSLYHCI